MPMEIKVRSICNNFFVLHKDGKIMKLYGRESFLFLQNYIIYLLHIQSGRIFLSIVCQDIVEFNSLCTYIL